MASADGPGLAERVAGWGVVREHPIWSAVGCANSQRIGGVLDGIPASQAGGSYGAGAVKQGGICSGLTMNGFARVSAEVVPSPAPI